MEHVATLINK